MIGHLGEFGHIAQWLEQNLYRHNGTLVENVRFDMKFYSRLYSVLAGGPLADSLLSRLRAGESAFYGSLSADVLVRQNDKYISPWRRDLFYGLPIRIVSRCWEESDIGGANFQRFRIMVVMFANDFPDLTASYKMMELMTHGQPI